MLEQDDRLSLEEEIEPLLRPVDLQEPVDDEDDEDDRRKDGQIDEGKASPFLALASEKNVLFSFNEVLANDAWGP
jgi:hypothetical protein